ncbi:MAG: amidohydrolase family protein, partial [Actinomycetota bacterium]
MDERHVERVGSGEPPPADRVVDLPDTTILPGFVDAHVHLSGTGMAIAGLDLSGARSREEAMSLVRAHATGPAEAILGQGFDETRWPDPALPTGAELDEVTATPVLLLRADGYVSVANASFRSASGIEPLDGVERAGSEPTGILRGRANSAAQLWYFESLPDRVIQEAQLRAAGLAASRGVTCAQEMAIPEKRGRRDVEVLLRQAPDLPLDLVVYVADLDIGYVMNLGQAKIGGDLFLDGSIGARTAALSSPYADSDEAGSLAYHDDELAEFLHNAHLAQFQTGLHVIG